MKQDFVILGGGVAGLTAAYELTRLGQRVTLIEQAAETGGLARTVDVDGFRFDLGGHRFHSNNPEVVAWLQALLGDDLLTVDRRSHIFLNGRFVDYPLAFPGALAPFSARRIVAIAGSYLLARARATRRARPDVDSFEAWVVRRFGRAMYAAFFQPYTEKVWGVAPTELAAEWAAQRIGLPSLWQAARSALIRPDSPPRTAVTRFYYPRLGFGMIGAALARGLLTRGGAMWTSARPIAICPSDDGFVVEIQMSDGERRRLATRELISTIPLPTTLALLGDGGARGTAPPDLHYRGLLCVFLALRRPRVTADHWTYFPEARFLFGRTHEPKNWSPAMVPDDACTSLCVEIFASPGSAAWRWSDAALHQQVVAQLAQLGWINPAEVAGGRVVRLAHAYPVYRRGYVAPLHDARERLAQRPGLHVVGRTGAFRYLNSDGVIEEVFRFLRRRFPAAPLPVSALADDDGRWV